MTALRARMWWVAALGALAVAGGDAAFAAVPQPCGPGQPSLTDQAVLDSETPLPINSWADLRDGRGRGVYAMNWEGMGHGTVVVDAIEQIRHGDLDGDGDRDAVAIVRSHPEHVPGGVPGARPEPGDPLASLVVWRNDDGRAVPVAAREVGAKPADLSLALERGLITFTYSTSWQPDDFDPAETRVNGRLSLRMRGPALVDVEAPQRTEQEPATVSAGPFEGEFLSHTAVLTVRQDGTWDYAYQTFLPEGGRSEPITAKGRVISREGDVATVRYDADGRREQWRYDAGNDVVEMEGGMMCGPAAPIGYCGA